MSVRFATPVGGFSSSRPDFGRIKGSAAPIHERYAVVCSDFRDGTFGEVRFFQTWRQALDAVGLSE